MERNIYGYLFQNLRKSVLKPMDAKTDKVDRGEVDPGETNMKTKARDKQQTDNHRKKRNKGLEGEDTFWARWSQTNICVLDWETQDCQDDHCTTWRPSNCEYVENAVQNHCLGGELLNILVALRAAFCT